MQAYIQSHKRFFIFSFIEKILALAPVNRVVRKLPYGKIVLSMASALNEGENPVDLYDYYLEDDVADSSGTAWENVADALLDHFKKINVSV